METRGIRRWLTRLSRRTVRRVLVTVCIAAGAAGASLFAQSSSQHDSGTYSLTGRVVRVADGDTFTLLVNRTRERVRMASIDAPEISHGSDRPGQDHGQAARQALAGMIAGKTLTLRCYEQDRYGRNICDVPLPGGSTVGRELVAGGWVWANRQGRDKYLRDSTLPGLMARAREQRLGLWQRSDAVAPWVWRYDCWRQGRC
ncbi:MAG: thermonuclease family protein [Alcaligenaceae bacterium]|nr:thermonuclease family protein [Alcaligenaceae bacterium]